VFTTGAAYKLQSGAVVQGIAALHVAIGAGSPSVSTQITALRRLLLGHGHGKLAAHFDDVVKVRQRLFQVMMDAVHCFLL
jgi:hypothetical protein